MTIDSDERVHCDDDNGERMLLAGSSRELIDQELETGEKRS